MRKSVLFLSPLLFRAMSTNALISQAPAWHSTIAKSIKKSRAIRGGNYVQLATVAGGEPRVRTVVFRGWHESDAPTMSFITDRRSQKVFEVSEQTLSVLSGKGF